MSEQTPPPATPQQPQQSFGQAPGGPESFGSAPPPQAGPPPAESTTPKKKSPLPRIIITVVIAIVVIGAGWWFSRDDAVKAEVGQCLAGTTPEELDADKLKIVDCSAADAGFKVVQKVEGKNKAESSAACTDQSAEFIFWSGKDEAKAGTTLCLARAK